MNAPAESHRTTRPTSFALGQDFPPLTTHKILNSVRKPFQSTKIPKNARISRKVRRTLTKVPTHSFQFIQTPLVDLSTDHVLNRLPSPRFYPIFSTLFLSSFLHKNFLSTNSSFFFLSVSIEIWRQLLDTHFLPPSFCILAF